MFCICFYFVVNPFKALDAMPFQPLRGLAIQKIEFSNSKLLVCPAGFEL